MSIENEPLELDPRNKVLEMPCYYIQNLLMRLRFEQGKMITVEDIGLANKALEALSLVPDPENTVIGQSGFDTIKGFLIVVTEETIPTIGILDRVRDITTNLKYIKNN